VVGSTISHKFQAVAPTVFKPYPDTIARNQKNKYIFFTIFLMSYKAIVQALFLGLLVAIVLSAPPLGVVSAANSQGSNPESCVASNATQDTSADGSMYVGASAAYNFCSNANAGVSYFTANFGGKYVYSLTIVLCGQVRQLPPAHNLAYGYALSSVCAGFVAINLTFGQSFSYTYPSEAGPIAVNTTGWSGNCANFYTGSACVATTLASAPITP